jgi:hypothetical protein
VASCTGTSSVCLTCWMACQSLSFHVLFHTPFVLLLPPSHTHFNTSRVLSQSLSSFRLLVWCFALIFFSFLSNLAIRRIALAYAGAPLSSFFSHCGLCACCLFLAHSRVFLSHFDPSSYLALVSWPSHIRALFAPVLRTLFLCMLPASSAVPFWRPANAV